jgi:hypothetical protein
MTRKGVAAALMTGLVGLGGLAGCTQESGVERETTIKGPEGTTTIEQESTIRKSGDNPPPVTGGDSTTTTTDTTTGASDAGLSSGTTGTGTGPGTNP